MGLVQRNMRVTKGRQQQFPLGPGYSQPSRGLHKMQDHQNIRLIISGDLVQLQLSVTKAG